METHFNDRDEHLGRFVGPGDSFYEAVTNFVSPSREWIRAFWTIPDNEHADADEKFLGRILTVDEGQVSFQFWRQDELLMHGTMPAEDFLSNGFARELREGMVFKLFLIGSRLLPIPALTFPANADG